MLLEEGVCYDQCILSRLAFALLHSVLQGKPLSITVIQAYAQTSNTEGAEVEQFYKDIQDLLELTPKKDVLFIIGDWNETVGN